MKLERGDYAILKEDKRHFLIKTLDVGKQCVGVIADRSLASKATETRVTFKADEIVANLGDDPTPGTVYGVKAEPWRARDIITPWGDVHYFREVDRREHRALKDALKRVGAEVTDRRLADSLPIEIHVRPKRGKYAGMYATRGGDNIDIVTYHPESLGEDMDYVIWHEDGHRIWFRHLDDELRARWITFYHESVQLANYSQDEIDSMLDDFRHSDQSLKVFGESIPEGEAGDAQFAMLQDIIGWIIGWHSLSRANIDLMFSEYPEKIVELWPKREIENMDKELVISEYAKTKAEEFFAEAWAFHFTGRELPSRVTNAVERTYEAIGGR